MEKNEINSHLDEKLKNFGSFNQYFLEIVKETAYKKIELLDENNCNIIKESIDELIKNTKNEVYVIEDFLEEMNLNTENEIINDLFNYLKNNLKKYGRKVNNEDKIVTINKAITDVRDYLKQKDYSESEDFKKISCITNFFAFASLNRYLFYEQKIYQKKSTSKWIKFIFSNYSTYLEDKILPRSTTLTWRDQLFEKLSEPEEENILFKDFDEWINENYVPLVKKFYSWSLKKFNNQSSITGLLITSIMNYLIERNEQVTANDSFSRSAFQEMANGINSQFLNKNIKEIISNYLGKGVSRRYENIINSDINHFIKLSNVNNPTFDTLKLFSQTTTKLFLNYMSNCLGKKIENFEEQNNYRVKYAKWLNTIEEKIDKTLSQGIQDEFFDKAGFKEINQWFNIQEELNIKELIDIRASQGILLRILGRIMNKMKLSGELNGTPYEKFKEKSVGELVNAFMQDKWSEYYE